MPEGWNRRMQAKLAEAVRRLPSVPGHGTAGNWREQHFLVLADIRRVVRIARRFRQLGIVAVRAGQPARLMLLPRSVNPSPAREPRSPRR